MELARLKYFCTVVQLGSISAAARKLYLTQPTLSKMISKLEQELDVTLFDRSGSKLTLNPAGQRFYSFASETVAAFEQCMKELHRADRRTISLRYSKDVDLELLLDSCQSHYLDCLLDAQPEPAEQLQLLQPGQGVHGVFLSLPDRQNAGWARLCPQSWWLVAHRNHPLMQEPGALSLPEMGNYVVGFSGDQATVYLFQQAYRYYQINPGQFSYEVASSDTLLALTRNQRCAVLTYAAAAGLFEARPGLMLAARPIQDSMISSSICARILAEPEDTLAMAVFKDLCDLLKQSREKHIRVLMELSARNGTV